MSTVTTAPVPSAAADSARAGDSPREQVAAARRGDPAAWQSLVEEHNKLLHWVAASHDLDAHDRADLVQSVWVTCLEKIGQLHDDAAFTGWLVTIARRMCWQMVERGRRCRPVDMTVLSELGQAEQDVAAEVARRDQGERLWEAVADLPEHQRRVIHALAENDGPDYAATARRLGMPIGSLGPTRARAVRRLRRDPRLALVG